MSLLSQTRLKLKLENRCLAPAGQNDIVELFARGEDVYRHMASIIYKPQDHQEGQAGTVISKIAVLGLGYSMDRRNSRPRLRSASWTAG